MWVSTSGIQRVSGIWRMGKVRRRRTRRARKSVQEMMRWPAGQAAEKNKNKNENYFLLLSKTTLREREKEKKLRIRDIRSHVGPGLLGWCQWNSSTKSGAWVSSSAGSQEVSSSVPLYLSHLTR